MTLHFHPLADLFPLIEGDDFSALVRDVKKNGLREAICLHEGKILDGRNRYRAALKAGIKMPEHPTASSGYVRDFNPKYDGDPLAYVISKNLARRHLNPSQLSMVADSIAVLRQGEAAAAKKPAKLPVTKKAQVEGQKLRQADAAAIVGVSERSVRTARVVREKGDPALVAAVTSGKMAVSLAAQAAALPVDQQLKVVAEVNAGRANAVRTVVKREARAAKEMSLGAKQRALPKAKFGVIYADPEWRFEPRSRETGMDRAPENHYPTSPTAIIAARPVGEIAAKDCALFLWATAPMMPQALEVMAAWGFKYQTHCVWIKERKGAARGPGFWFTGEHELLLLGTKGAICAPAPGQQWRSIVTAPVGAHSEKPEKFYELIEDYYFPSLPKIELNARRKRKGWTSWGFEAPETEGAP